MATAAVSTGISKRRGVWSKKYSDGATLNYSTFVTYSSGQGGRGISPGSLETYLMYERDRGLAGREWVTAAKLGNDGKFIPLTESQAFRVTGETFNKLEPIGGTNDKKVLGDLALSDLNSGGRTSLRYQTINNAKYLLKKDSGESEAVINNAYNVSNIRPPGDEDAPGGLYGPPVSADEATSEPVTPETIDGINERQNYDNVRPTGPFLEGTYVYPSAIKTNGQDYIQFTLYEYGTRDVVGNAQNPSPIKIFEYTERTEKKLGNVILPIQQGISDQNMISWADENMSPIAIAMMKSAANPESIGGTISGIVDTIAKDSGYQKLIQQQIYGAAAGINPLSRLSGLVINPNLELLFSGPTLRPFNFTFRMSPRSGDEANSVKNIIRFFKQGSVVRTTNDNLFLKAPNVFKIQYVFGKNSNKSQPGLNMIKTCALRNITVNYNPDGSYMTFEDGTMTSYEMILQFSELEPVYDVDYEESSSNGLISSDIRY